MKPATTQTPATAVLAAQSLARRFEAALTWADYLATDPAKAANWESFYGGVSLTAEQTRLVEGFSRNMKVLCVSGIWCGDCVQQGPLMQRIAEANPLIELRFCDRDENLELAEAIKINDGLRVPVAIFMAEDFEPVSLYGDRSLVRYRAMAARNLGAACPLPGAPVDPDEAAATLQDWLDEFERVQLLLRLSTRLRQKHGN
jgi:thiol-disulfide isomerase/thioredoxin